MPGKRHVAPGVGVLSQIETARHGERRVVHHFQDAGGARPPADADRRGIERGRVADRQVAAVESVRQVLTGSEAQRTLRNKACRAGHVEYATGSGHDGALRCRLVAQMRLPARDHDGVVRDVHPGCSGVGVVVLEHNAPHRVAAAQEPRVRRGVAALDEVRLGRIQLRLRVNVEIDSSAAGTQIEVLAEGESSAPDVEVLPRGSSGLPCEERVFETPDLLLVRNAVESLEVEDVRAGQIQGERRTPPVVDAFQPLLLPERAARVDGERMRPRAGAEEDRTGVLHESSGGCTQGDVLRLEVHVAVTTVNAVGGHDAVRPVGGVVVAAVRHGGKPLDALVICQGVGGKDLNRAKGQHPNTGLPNHILHVMFLSSVVFHFVPRMAATDSHCTPTLSRNAPCSPSLACRFLLADV